MLSSGDLPAMELSLDALKIREEMQAQWDKRIKYLKVFASISFEVSIVRLY